MKNNYKIIKILCIILSFTCFLTSFSFLAYTISLEENSMISIADCETLATYWLELYYDDATVIDEIIPISDGENICSYCVSFISNNSPNGYIVIDSDKYANNNIAEFSFSDLGIYETLCENSGKSIESSTNKVIYSTGLFDYAISVNCDNTLFYNSTNEFFNKQEIEKRCKQKKSVQKLLKNNLTNQQIHIRVRVIKKLTTMDFLMVENSQVQEVTLNIPYHQPHLLPHLPWATIGLQMVLKVIVQQQQQQIF